MRRHFAIAAQNFREIGPLPTRDGRTLRPGLLFRSGDLSDLTQSCVAQMQALGIRSVIDLRSVMERQAHPYGWLSTIDEGAWGDPAEQSPAAIGHLIDRADSTMADMVEAVRALYRALPFDHAASYATLFRRIAEGVTPLLFGCAAGKDRTGVGAALLLWSIGVEPEAIMDDYLASNLSQETLLALARKKYGWDTQSPKIGPLLRAEPVFLDAMMAEVTTRCGGIDAYVEQVLGLSRAQRSDLERALLG